MSRTQLDAALDRLKLAHGRIHDFTRDLAADEWFWSPAEFTTHISTLR